MPTNVTSTGGFIPDFKSPAVICDLDGTLRFADNRDLYQPDLCATDTLCNTVQQILTAYYGIGHKVLFVTGVPMEFMRPTVGWLRKQGWDGSMNPIRWRYDALVMRPTGSYISNDEWKRQAVIRLLRSYDIKLAIDDNPKAAAVYASKGIDSLHFMRGWRKPDVEQ